MIDMDKIEKIRQEIERRKKICEGIFERESDTYYQGKAVAYGELLPFLDTLEEESDKSLKEAAENYADKHGFRVPYDGTDNFYDDTDVKASKDGFIAGAKWAFRQGWTFDTHKGAFGIRFDGNIDNLLDSLKDKEEVTIQIRKK